MVGKITSVIKLADGMENEKKPNFLPPARVRRGPNLGVTPSNWKRRKDGERNTTVAAEDRPKKRSLLTWIT